jgi:hypothetical protein
MTTTYTNITLIDVDPEEAAQWLAENSVTAAISPSIDDIIVIYENILAEHTDNAEPLEPLLDIASEISYELGCIAWLVMVDNDEVLIYTLYNDGDIIDGYGVRAGEAPEGGDPEGLVDLFGVAKRQVKVVRAALNRELNPQQETASERLTKVLTALSLPTIAVGYDCARVMSGDTPAAFLADEILTVGEDDENE